MCGETLTASWRCIEPCEEQKKVRVISLAWNHKWLPNEIMHEEEITVALLAGIKRINIKYRRYWVILNHESRGDYYKGSMNS